MRSPFFPEIRAQSSGLVVFGRSSVLMPFSPVDRNRLIASFFALRTMFSIIAPELKSLK